MVVIVVTLLAKDDVELFEGDILLFFLMNQVCTIANAACAGSAKKKKTVGHQCRQDCGPKACNDGNWIR